MAVQTDAEIDLAKRAGRGLLRISDGNGHVQPILVEVRMVNGRLFCNFTLDRTAQELATLYIPVPK